MTMAEQRELTMAEQRDLTMAAQRDLTRAEQRDLTMSRAGLKILFLGAGSARVGGLCPCGGRHPPDCVSDIVGDQQGARLVQA